MKSKYSNLKTLSDATMIVLCLFLIPYSSCKDPVVDPPEPTETERVAKLLEGTGTPWVIQSVKVDDVVLDLYKNLNVAFTADGKYTSTNGGVLWPASGTWKFKDDTAKAIVREDGLEISIEVTEKSLTITFTRDGGPVFDPGGRSKAVGGKHVITLGR